MKTIILILPILILLLLPCGCATVPEQTMYPCPDLGDTAFFLENYSKMPEEERVLAIEKGMFFYEVVERIGKPYLEVYHETSGHTPAVTTFVWKTKEGSFFSFDFEPVKKIAGSTEMSIAEYHQYTAVVLGPDIYELNLLDWVYSHPQNIHLEPNKELLPTYEQLQQIEEGMTLDEVTALIGAPQHAEIIYIPVMPTASAAMPEWAQCYETSEGKTVRIVFRLDAPGAALYVYRIL